REAEQSLVEVGRDALLASELPRLISGWAGNAFHPLIRLAYGYHFQIDGEIAAGLAYLKWCGPNEKIKLLADAAAADATPGDLRRAVESLSPCAERLKPGARFDDRLATVLEHPAFAGAARTYPDALTTISGMALRIFAQTHDFFALHLVTGSHAYRLLYPFAGELRDEIFSLGILAGYAAIGAPTFQFEHEPIARQGVTADSGALAAELDSDDDHDIKLTYSALCQAQHFEDDAYLAAASGYLAR
ncbi:MAG: DUF4243 domain-containing protein, partial [Gammaproteobacteria bacterium]